MAPLSLRASSQAAKTSPTPHVPGTPSVAMRRQSQMPSLPTSTSSTMPLPSLSTPSQTSAPLPPPALPLAPTPRLPPAPPRPPALELSVAPPPDPPVPSSLDPQPQTRTIIGSVTQAMARMGVMLGEILPQERRYAPRANGIARLGPMATARAAAFATPRAEDPTLSRSGPCTPGIARRNQASHGGPRTAFVVCGGYARSVGLGSVPADGSGRGALLV